MGLFPVWRHKLLWMHVYKDLLRCKSVRDVKPGIDPYPLLPQSWNRSWSDFVTFAACKKSRFSLKRRSAFLTSAKIYFNEKKYFWVSCTLTFNCWLNRAQIETMCDRISILALWRLVFGKRWIMRAKETCENQSNLITRKQIISSPHDELHHSAAKERWKL